MNEKRVMKATARIGIVNRGEAAVRFIRAVKEFNLLYGTQLKTVAFYTEIEKDATFVKESDYIYHMPDITENNLSPYLDHQVIIKALLENGCRALWPGWGFVAEDAAFAALAEEKGIIFLGPDSQAIRMLGNKVQAKELAEKAEVPVLPWSKVPIKDIAHAREVAKEIQYPLIIKAANAGGGRGIRFVHKEEDLEKQLLSAREETLRIAGDEIVFIERLVGKARHLEVQIAADYHGEVRAFGVRDCTAQRRNQKIIEETPPPAFEPEQIEKLEKWAKDLARAAQYQSVGTVEFIFDLERNEPYFMEVNTRLQVEHPITEQIFGVDLVKLQLDIAMGNKLTKNYQSRGVALEARLNAEDPEKNFMPAPGRVSVFVPPAGPGIRIDSGVEQDSIISNNFDSMIAKIIAWAPEREEAIARLKRALQEIRIKVENGITNRSFLLDLLETNQFKNGQLHTCFVEEWLEGQIVREKSEWDIALLAYALEQFYQRRREEFSDFCQQFVGWGSPRTVSVARGQKIDIALDGHDYSFAVESVGNNLFHVEIDGQTIVVHYSQEIHESILLHQDKRFCVQAVERGDTVQCEINGVQYSFESDSGNVAKSPSPAMVISVPVKAGQKVAKGDTVVILETMKMEMVIAAPERGVVKSIEIKEGEQVAAGQPLVYFEEEKQINQEVLATSPRISFERLAVQTKDEFEILAQKLFAAFLGYDHLTQPMVIFQNLQNKYGEQKEKFIELGQLYLKILQCYAHVEQLFSSEQLHSDGFARAVSYRELLAHYFKREENKDQGMPEQFLEILHKAKEYYYADEKHILFRIYQSHANQAAKQEVLRALFFSLKNILGKTPTILPEDLADTFDAIMRLTQMQSPSVADAARECRYLFCDRLLLENIKEERRGKVEKLLQLVSQTSNNRETKEKLVEDIVEAGYHIVYYLVKMTLEPEAQKSKVATELLGRRLIRDRAFVSGEIIEREGILFYSGQSKNRQKHYHSVACVIPESNQAILTKAMNVIENIGENYPDEVMIFSWQKDNNTIEEIYNAAAPLSQKGHLCLGLFYPDGKYFYRTFIGGQENTSRRFFTPLMYRELRVDRLARFHLQLLYRSDYVYLLQAKAIDNPKDERFFALAEVPETYADFDKAQGIHRIVVLEHALMDATQAIRAHQARRKRRLHWNRIIIHIRSFLQTNLRQIENYAARLAPRAGAMGLEKVIVYARNNTRKGREIELLFENISGHQFTLRSRIPSTKLMEPMDKYVAKVVRARQRGTVYPYEIIKMITRPGYAGNEKFPRGEFEEFDLKINQESGEQKIVSVKNRPYGGNVGNIVFGIITSFASNHQPYNLKRIIILADPTKDMASLAEAECRRVIAALDMAEEQGLPVEWIPVSAGARIDMDSGTENLDWTARTLKRIIEFTQSGGEINIIVPGINVGAQSYWNSEATMLMHTRGILIMTDNASMLLTGKKTLDFSGSVSAEDNIGIGGVERIMAPNGQAQMRVDNLSMAYGKLFEYYDLTYAPPGTIFPRRIESEDPIERDICVEAYDDHLGQGFCSIGDIFSMKTNPERKKPFDMRQVMRAVIDKDTEPFERWQQMTDAETAIVWHTRLGGYGIGMIGIESRPLTRLGVAPNDGPEAWSGGTLFPQSSKKVARAINAFNRRLPIVVLANLSGFDGSPESLRKCQLEFGAEIGRAVVNFQGPIIFVVVARYHGGAYVVFSRTLNPLLKTVAIEGTYASVIGGKPAAAVVFPRLVQKETNSDPRIVEAQSNFKQDDKLYQELWQNVYAEKQSELAARFDQIHSIERAQRVKSIHDIIKAHELRPYLVQALQEGMEKFTEQGAKK